MSGFRVLGCWVFMGLGSLDFRGQGASVEG